MSLNERLAPVSRLVATLDLSDAPAAEARLIEAFPPDGETTRELVAAARTALAEGAICDREKGGIRFSRVLKPDADEGGCSIDAVLMENAKGPGHTHDAGEVCLCIAEDGTPRFDGREGTWLVMPKGSRHEPTVEGGRMLILYWWPGGAVTWG